MGVIANTMIATDMLQKIGYDYNEAYSAASMAAQCDSDSEIFEIYHRALEILEETGSEPRDGESGSDDEYDCDCSDCRCSDSAESSDVSVDKVADSWIR